MPEQIDILGSQRIRIFKMRTAVVHILSVRCPEREHLQFIGVVLDVRHLILFHVVGYQIALRIIHLHLVGVTDVEVLACHVR